MTLASMLAAACTADFAVRVHEDARIADPRDPHAPPPTPIPVETTRVQSGIAYGAYSGDGTDGRVIELGFPPAVVFVLLENGEGTVSAVDLGGVVRVTNPTGSKRLNASAALEAGLVTGFTSSGFTVDGHALTNAVNCGLQTCRYHFVALAQASDLASAGTYTGDGGIARGLAPGAGFIPEAGILVPAGGLPASLRTRNFLTNGSQRTDGGGRESDHILELSADDDGGMTIGGAVNLSAQSYFYATFGQATRIRAGTYEGTGTAAVVEVVGIRPDIVFAQNVSSPGEMFLKTLLMPDPISVSFSGVATQQALQSLDLEGFTVGNFVDVNAPGQSFHFLAIKLSVD